MTVSPACERAGGKGKHFQKRNSTLPVAPAGVCPKGKKKKRGMGCMSATKEGKKKRGEEFLPLHLGREIILGRGKKRSMILSNSTERGGGKTGRMLIS